MKTHQVWALPNNGLCLKSCIYKLFTIGPLLTQNDLWLPKETFKYLHLMCYTYIVNKRFVQAFTKSWDMDLQHFHNLTPADHKWPLTPKVVRFLLLALNVVCLHTKWLVSKLLLFWYFVYKIWNLLITKLSLMVTAIGFDTSLFRHSMFLHTYIPTAATLRPSVSQVQGALFGPRANGITISILWALSGHHIFILTDYIGYYMRYLMLLNTDTSNIKVILPFVIRPCIIWSMHPNYSVHHSCASKWCLM